MISRAAATTPLIWRRSLLVSPTSSSLYHQPLWSSSSVQCFSSTTPKKATKKKVPKVPTVFNPVGDDSDDEEGKSVVSKDDLVRVIAESHELSFAKSKRILDTVLNHIVENVSESKAVRIGNFGTFSAHTVAARKGRNPQNGEPLEIPSKERIRFKPFTAFKTAVQSKDDAES